MMNIVEIAKQQQWSPAEFRSQVVRAAAAIGAMELEQLGVGDELTLSGFSDNGMEYHMVIRRLTPSSDSARN